MFGKFTIAQESGEGTGWPRGQGEKLEFYSEGLLCARPGLDFGDTKTGTCSPSMVQRQGQPGEGSGPFTKDTKGSNLSAVMSSLCDPGQVISPP